MSKTKRKSTSAPQPKPSRRAASLLSLETYVRLAERLAAERTRERWRQVQELTPAELDAEREREQWADRVRTSFEREIDGWLYDQNLPRWDDLSPLEHDRLLMQWARDAHYRRAKRKSGETRAGRPEVAPDEVLAAFDRKRSSFPSRTATATNVAKHETFIVQHQRRRTRPVGSKVRVSRNLILGLVAQRDGKERRPPKTR